MCSWMGPCWILNGFKWQRALYCFFFFFFFFFLACQYSSLVLLASVNESNNSKKKKKNTYFFLSSHIDDEIFQFVQLFAFVQGVLVEGEGEDSWLQRRGNILCEIITWSFDGLWQTWAPICENDFLECKFLLNWIVGRNPLLFWFCAFRMQGQFLIFLFIALLLERFVLHS